MAVADGQALIVPIDLRRASALGDVVSKVIAAFGSMGACINIAGAVLQAHLVEMTGEEYKNGTALKLGGARRLTMQAWAGRQASKGSVHFTSGNSALFPKAVGAATGTIKAAIVALSKAFADRDSPTASRSTVRCRGQS